MHLLLVLLLTVLFFFGFTVCFSRFARTKFPPRGKFVTVDGTRIHYLENGSGPPLLLIHGLTGSSLNFEYALIGELAASFRVIAIDRPGSGHSQKGASASLPAQAAMIAEVMAKLGIEKIFVVGHSLGGAVALQLAADRPDLVTGLALVSPLTHLMDDVPAAFRALKIRSPLLRWIYSRTFSTFFFILGHKNTSALIFHPEAPPKDFNLRGGGLMSADYLTYYNASTDLLALDPHLGELIKRYPSIRMPVSILFGEDDQILECRSQCEPFISLGPNFRIEYTTGGHMLVTSHPQLVRDFVLKSHV